MRLGYVYDVGPDVVAVDAADLRIAHRSWRSSSGCCVPESQRWLAARNSGAAASGGVSMATVFRPPLLRLTLIGIALGTIPILGGWGATQWFIPWADKVGGVADPQGQSAGRP